MFSLDNYEDIFNLNESIFYNDHTIMCICDNRKSLEVLFIDRIMKILGIKKPHRLYPPKPTEGLRNLHKAVIETTGTDHYKLSVFYYVLLEYDRMMNTDECSKSLEQKSFLPKKYQTLIKGLWHMDHQEFQIALQYLAHPSLIPSFPNEILEVLSRASKGDTTLAIAYYHCVQPALKDQRTINIFFSQLARASVTEAFYFIRTRNEYYQQHTFQMLIHLVLSQSSNDTMSERCLELINLPFTPQENQWFEEYLQLKEGKALKGAKDILIMRRIGTGKFSDFTSLQSSTNKTVYGLNWDVISDAVSAGLGPRSNS